MNGGQPLANPIRTPDSPPSDPNQSLAQQSGGNQVRHVAWDSSAGVPPPLPPSATISPKDSSDIAPPPPALSPHMPSVRSAPTTPMFVPVQANNSNNHDRHRGNSAQRQQHPLSPPPPPPPPSDDTSEDTEAASSKKKEARKETIWTRILEVVFSCISFSIIMAGISMYIISKRIDVLGSTIGVDPEVRSIPPLMTISAVFIIIVMIIGFVALCLQSRTIAYVYIGSLLILFLGQGYETYRMSKSLDVRLQSLTNNWNQLPSITKSEIQIFGNCCGYYDPMDRPGEWCPEGTTVGCRYRLKEAERAARTTASDAIFVSIFLVCVLSALLWFITRK